MTDVRSANKGDDVKNYYDVPEAGPLVLRVHPGVHRGAQSGAGGGVSSTGSSSTASGWSGHLGALAQNDFPAALRLAVIDQLNAHWVNGNLSPEVAFQIMQVVNGHAALGRLTAIQAGEINNHIADYCYSRLG